MPSRSKESFEFEKFWQSLRNEGSLPGRDHFRSARAARYLRSIILFEAPDDARPHLKIKLAGQLYQDLVPYKVAGTDYLDILPSKHHAGAIASAHLMIDRPCGLWQITPMHLARGYAQLLEVTAFPLAAGEDSIPLIIAFLLPIEGPLPATLPLDKGIAADTAMEFCFLDVGAGQPEWPAEAA
jgi:hypothetical protein